MADLDQLIAMRDRLERARFKGVLEYQIGDRQLRYKSDQEMAAALKELNAQIAKMSGPASVRTIRLSTSKGL